MARGVTTLLTKKVEDVPSGPEEEGFSSPVASSRVITKREMAETDVQGDSLRSSKASSPYARR